MSLMRNTPDRSYAGKAKKVDENITPEQVVDIVNTAIEEGQIEVGEEYWTKVTYGGKDYLAQVNTENFTTPNFLWGMNGNFQALSILYNNTVYPIITIFSQEVSLNRIRAITLTGKGEGSAGQVLGKDSNNVLNWITPSHLYRHRIWIVGVCRIENTDAMVYASLDLFSTSNANFTMSNLLAELSTDATQQIMATGMIGDENDKVYSIFGAFKDNNKVSFKCFTSGDVDPHITEQPEGYTIGLTDTVTQIL